MFTHGGTWNNIPVRVDEKMMGDYLRPNGYRVGIVGKTHFKPDRAGMKKLGISVDGDLGVLLGECGFEPWERDDGLHPDQSLDPDLSYNRYLRENGYSGDNPWHTVANSAEGSGGEVLSGWSMRNVQYPARVDKKHSETAFMTDRAMQVIEELDDNPWCLHLSYIKPHWPYMAPDPYHALYSTEDIIPAIRSDRELLDRHPVVSAFGNHEESINFSRDECRKRVIPAYMGLISELDFHIGRLIDFLKIRGDLDNTVIVLTSDHGDYLGDHWLGEKELFYEPAIRIPLIVINPDKGAEKTRGTSNKSFVESIDLLPTFLGLVGCQDSYDHRLEGRSLLPLIHGEEIEWRDAIFCESDYSVRQARNLLKRGPEECRAFMIRTNTWKYIYYDGFAPQLFNLEEDPDEMNDLGKSKMHKDIRGQLFRQLFDWMRTRKLRPALSNKEIASRTGKGKQRGYLIGVW
jgi:arylsulfatase A-like enzyme